MTDEQKAVERQNLIDILDRNFGYTDDEPAYVVADRLIAAGYRKQSDTVMEIYNKIYDNLPQVCDWRWLQGARWAMQIAAEFGGEEK